ncbi:hypothetical protein M9H77_12564 [Catharanthus roseus]|uniref:Uncharacterized protein n=1 Tax=Catharanthus roseus TaxID=4058 RepID=A0ACC0BHP8_CATRO|nr:hypothetical protein M9H77_12564 [Catharanthus roseus]
MKIPSNQDYSSGYDLVFGSVRGLHLASFTALLLPCLPAAVPPIAGLLLAPPLLSSLSQSATIVDNTQHTHTANESRQHQPNWPSCAAVCFLRHHHRRARSPTRRRKRRGFPFCLSQRGSGAAVRERLGEREEEN